jgi:uncharacterized protein YjbI with pentapeptide repeats
MRRLLRRFWSWTGIPERQVAQVDGFQVQPSKTLWDWMQLVLVPAILIGATIVWSATQTSSANKREDRRSQDAMLQSYLTEMSGLTLGKKLLSSKVDDPIRRVARTATITVLHRLDSDRKEEVVLSLSEAWLLSRDCSIVQPHAAEAGLLSSDCPIVDLHGADLRGVNLNGADLSGTDLHVVDLEGAHLEGANLFKISLLGAHLEGAHLNRADLTMADLSGANLTGADLTGAILTGADLTGAVLTAAKGLPKRSR